MFWFHIFMVLALTVVTVYAAGRSFEQHGLGNHRWSNDTLVLALFSAAAAVGHIKAVNALLGAAS